VVLVRSPPFSGKTSLAELYLHYVKAARGEAAVLVSFLGLRDPGCLDEFWKRECRGVSWEAHFQSTTRITVILDEAQFIYTLGQGHPFWNAVQLAMTRRDFKTTQARVLVFAAHGERPREGAPEFATTPIAFPRKLDMKHMMFSRAEFDDVMARYGCTGKAARLTIGPGMYTLLAF
jgi:hypothetical protein